MKTRIFRWLYPKLSLAMWQSGVRAGKRYATEEIQALIHSEIKCLNKARDDKNSKQRVFELLFILGEIVKLQENDD